MESAIALGLGLVLLHAPGGRVVYVNPHAIITMAVPSERSTVSKEAKCIMTTGDGKFLAVEEDCREVERIFEEAK